MNKKESQREIDAKNLVSHTLKITSNTNYFPKKYKFTLTNRIIDSSFRIYENILKLNNVQGEEYQILKTKILEDCKLLRGEIEISIEVLHTPFNFLFWSNLVSLIESSL